MRNYSHKNEVVSMDERELSCDCEILHPEAVAKVFGLKGDGDAGQTAAREPDAS
jgi:hypothetical protein